MSITCKNCSTSLNAGSQACDQCGLALDPPTPADRPTYTVLSKKTKLAWIAAGLVAAIMGIIGLASASNYSNVLTLLPQTSPTRQPGDGKLVGSWTSDWIIGGKPIHCVYLFNADNTMIENDTTSGQSASESGKYSDAADQVAINYDDGNREQATVTWDSPQQCHYKITHCSYPNQAGLEAVFTRQSQTAATQAVSGPGSTPLSSAISSMTADELAEAVNNSKVEADSMFQGQKITVTGEIQSVLPEPTDNPWALVILKTGVANYAKTNGETQNFEIFCYLSSGNKKPRLQFTQGQNAAVTGVYKSTHTLSMTKDNPTIMDCSILRPPS